MGNYRFKLSAMIPNAWFYKLKDMNRSANNNNTLPPSKKKHPLHQSQDSSSSSDLPLQHHHSSSSLPRKSYYFPRDLSPKLLSDTHQQQLELEPPRRSSKLSSPRPKRPPPPCRTSSAICSCRVSLDSVWTTKTTESSEYSICESSPEFRFDRGLTPDSFGNPCECGGANNNTDDIFIHVDENSFHGNNDLVHQEDHMLPQLPRIVTKPAAAKLKDCDSIIRSENRETQKSEKLRADSKAPSVVVNHKHKKNTGSGSSGNSRKFSLLHSPGKRLRIRSPRIQAQLARRMDSKRRSLTESFAIVKSSFDPHKDFRESMLEMIVEHNIKASKDLEELLACYLSLNSDEYHELIIKVFKQIWFDLTDIISFKG